jgi:hypothetical protein
MAMSNVRNTIAFTEVDETNNPTATYVYSETQEHANNPHEKSLSKRGRVDVMVCQALISRHILLFALMQLRTRPLSFTVDIETLDID